jgi:hemolysin activation/secretion protein
MCAIAPTRVSARKQYISFEVSNNLHYKLPLQALMLKIKYFPYVMLVLSAGVFAAQLPSAGSQQQQISPPAFRQNTLPIVEVGQGSATAVTESASEKIIVKRLQVTGALAYSETELLAVTGFKPGSALTLADLRNMAARIADYYHRNGYFVAFAYLPVQEIKEGVVSITVIDGQYGKVTLHNQSKLSDELAKNLVDGIKQGYLISSAQLERRLLLLSDLPGVKVKSILVPGISLGASDLIVELTPGQSVTGSVDADNAGNRYSGQNRIGATANLNNLAGHGDVVTLRALTSASGLDYLRVSYQMQFGKSKAGLAYSSLGYSLGSDFENLRASGTAKITEIYASYPLIRAHQTNLFVQLAYDEKTFQDKVDLTGMVTDKQARALMLSLNADHRDGFGNGGASNYSLAWTTGEIAIQTSDMRLLDATTAHSNGAYNKLGFSAMRLQSLTDSTSLYASVNGQWAEKNLDVSEKIELGGIYAVRAYPEGEAYADQGYVLNLETRTDLPTLFEKRYGQMQLIGFVDTGTVMINKNIWSSGPNRRTLSGAGAGINWTGANNFVVKAYYAHRLGNQAAISAPDSPARIWIQAVRYF